LLTVKNIKSFLLLLFFLPLFSQQIHAQSYTIEILGGNVLNGVLTGAALGGATMAITDNADLAPIRVGVGAGILYGIGVGVFDVSKAEGQKLLVQGSFNNGHNSAIIVLLDTGYGAAAGGIIATSAMLVANKPLLDGLQYGVAIGAYAGFGFGIFDAFVLSSRGPAPVASLHKKPDVQGLMTMSNSTQNVQLGFLSPALYNNLDISSSEILMQPQLGFNALNLKVRF
jgi:hypothetical protein